VLSAGSQFSLLGVIPKCDERELSWLLCWLHSCCIAGPWTFACRTELHRSSAPDSPFGYLYKLTRPWAKCHLCVCFCSASWQPGRFSQFTQVCFPSHLLAPPLQGVLVSALNSNLVLRRVKIFYPREKQNAFL